MLFLFSAELVYYYHIMEKIKNKMTNSKEKTHDYLAKIVIIGDSSVGKTNILLRFVSEHYTQSHTPTIGVDFKSKVIQVPTKRKTKRKIKLQLWDTAGQQRFRTITETYYTGASGIVIVYAINDRKSFSNVEEWLYQVNQHSQDNIAKIIIGNKCDLVNQRVVRFEEGRMLADQHKCAFMEISAKENINVNQMFTQLSMIINSNYEKENPNQSDEKRRKQNSIDNHAETDKKMNIIIHQQNKNNIKKKECCN